MRRVFCSLKIVLFAASLACFSAPAFAACTGPAGNASDVIYNKDYDVLQYCNGTSWKPMGHSPGTGGTGCGTATTDVTSGLVEAG